jgi:nitrogen PTS system EIIA component
MNIKLADVVRSGCSRARETPRDKQDLLRRIAELAATSEALEGVSAARIEEGLRAREDLGSTGFGGGIAIPHCRLPDLNEFTVGVMTVPGGVAFDSLDGDPVRAVVFIVAPDSRSSDHIRILSEISQALSRPGIVEELCAQSDPTALTESFLRHSAPEIAGDEGAGHQLVQILVQDEERFRALLELIGGIRPAYFTILEAENPGAYLRRLPLFAGFWTDPPSAFSRLVQVAIPSAMTNELIRRIEQAVGRLSNLPGVCVTVQDLFYCAGRAED